MRYNFRSHGAKKLDALRNVDYSPLQNCRQPLERTVPTVFPMKKGHDDLPIFEELLKGRNVAFASAVHARKNCLTNTLYLHSVAVSESSICVSDMQRKVLRQHGQSRLLLYTCQIKRTDISRDGRYGD